MHHTVSGSEVEGRVRMKLWSELSLNNVIYNKGPPPLTFMSYSMAIKAPENKKQHFWN